MEKIAFTHKGRPYRFQRSKSKAATSPGNGTDLTQGLVFQRSKSKAATSPYEKVHHYFDSLFQRSKSKAATSPYGTY